MAADAPPPTCGRSAALLAYSATPGQCKYAEVQAVKTMLGACMGTAAMAVGGLCLALPPMRRLLFWLKLLPLPGEGLSAGRKCPLPCLSKRPIGPPSGSRG